MWDPTLAHASGPANTDSGRIRSVWPQLITTSRPVLSVWFPIRDGSANKLSVLPRMAHRQGGCWAMMVHGRLIHAHR